MLRGGEPLGGCFELALGGGDLVTQQLHLLPRLREQGLEFLVIRVELASAALQLRLLLREELLLVGREIDGRLLLRLEHNPTAPRHQGQEEGRQKEETA